MVLRFHRVHRGQQDALPRRGWTPAAESIRGAKEWLSRRMQVSYRPVADQPALTARFDMALARRRAPSFDKMWRAVRALVHRA